MKIQLTIASIQEKPTTANLFGKFPAFYGARKFCITYKTSHQCILRWAYWSNPHNKPYFLKYRSQIHCSIYDLSPAICFVIQIVERAIPSVNKLDNSPIALSWSYRPNHNWRKHQIMKIINRHYSQYFCYYHLFSSKYNSLHPECIFCPQGDRTIFTPRKQLRKLEIFIPALIFMPSDGESKQL